MQARDFARFDDNPWLAGGSSRLGPARAVPTMLAHEEELLYHWLTGSWAEDRGAIVELGSFIGGSTARLAEGHRKAGLSKPIHAYDRFKASEALKKSLLYPSGIKPFSGEDIFDLAQDLLSPWAPAVVFHRGEIQEIGWCGDPIEILAVDAAKSTAATDAMARDFFPSLLPDAVVVQQDYLHWRQPWIAAQMQLMRDWFEPVAYAMDETLVFRCLKPVDGAALEAGRTDHLSDADLIAILEEARPTYAKFGVEARLTDAVSGIRRSPGTRIAWKMTAP